MGGGEFPALMDAYFVQSQGTKTESNQEGWVLNRISAETI